MNKLVLFLLSVALPVMVSAACDSACMQTCYKLLRWEMIDCTRIKCGCDSSLIDDLVPHISRSGEIPNIPYYLDPPAPASSILSDEIPALSLSSEKVKLSFDTDMIKR